MQPKGFISLFTLLSRLLYFAFLLGSFFDNEKDGMFLRNVG
jgi:hypothetical protein